PSSSNKPIDQLTQQEAAQIKSQLKKDPTGNWSYIDPNTGLSVILNDQQLGQLEEIAKSPSISQPQNNPQNNPIDQATQELQNLNSAIGELAQNENQVPAATQTGNDKQQRIQNLENLY